MQALLNLSSTQTIFDYDYNGYTHGMLPVADKPFASYLLDQLAQEGYEKVFIVTTDETQDVTKTLGDGTYWSNTIEYINIDSPEGMRKCTDLQYSGIREVRPEDVLVLSQKMTQRGQVANFESYMNKSLSIISDTSTFQVPSFQVRPNIFLCEGAKTRAASNYPLHLGKYAELKSSCLLRGPSIIGAGAVVETGNILDNTVIMPNTHVGKNLDLSNCLVTPKWVYHRVTKGIININEVSILSAA